MKINFKKHWFLFALLAINFVLLFLHLYFGPDWDFFNFDKEWNLPSYWSAIQLFIAGVLWFSFTEIRKNDKIQKHLRIIYRYLGTSLFFYLAIDELFQLHEKLGDRGGEILINTSWREYFILNKVFAWLWIFLPVVLLFLAFVIYQGWKLLSKRSFLILTIGVLVYVLGAYGIEVIGWLVWHNKLDLNYFYLITIEEFLEMLGVSIIAFKLAERKTLRNRFMK